MTELTAIRTADGAWTFEQQDPSIVAAGIPASPPADWFEPRQFDCVTPLTFTADGQVYGHVADRSIPHIGLPGQRTAPRSKSGYRWYMTGQVRCDDGSLISTGRITMGAGHASLEASAESAAAHYDNTATAVADVVAWDDQFGVCVAGAARPGVTEDQMRTAMASPPSGDWRVINGDLEMVAALLVNVPGFPSPRVNLAASGAVQSLVAAGVIPRTPNPEQEAVVAAPNQPAPPAPADGPSADGTVMIGDTGLVGQVVEQAESGDVVVEVTVPASELHAASDEQAVAASAKRTQRQQMRALAASVNSLSEQLAARDRADTARELLASLPVE